MKPKIIFLIIAIFTSFTALAQPAGDKQINPYHQRYADSLKNMDYHSLFPLWGAKAYKKGFDIPLAYGVGMNYFYMRQRIAITNTQIGFNGDKPIDLSNTITYGDVMNTTNVLTFRPDLWIFPFLNVYGVAGYGSSQVVVPITAIAGFPVDFSTTQNFGVSSLGFGLTIAGGIGPVFLTIDNNMNWAKTTVVEAAIPAYNLDARIGHSFISPRHPEQSLTIWIGAFMQTLKSSTVGHIQMAEVLSPEKAQSLKDYLNEKIINDPKLNPVEQQFLENLIDQGIDQLASSTVDYQLDKKIAGPWNLIFGAQYQYNKHWQARLEMGAFGERSQFMFSVNYRFQ